MQDHTGLHGRCCPEVISKHAALHQTDSSCNANSPMRDAAWDAAQVDPELEGPTLPSQREDEFRPFVRRLPEFKFWCVALCTRICPAESTMKGMSMWVRYGLVMRLAAAIAHMPVRHITASTHQVASGKNL